MKILLRNTTTNELEWIDDITAVHNMYYGLNAVPTDEELLKSKYKGVKSYDIKVQVSKLEYTIPLYDEDMNNLFLVDRNDVYDKITHNNFRVPNQDVIDRLRALKIEMAKKIKANRKLTSTLDEEHRFYDIVLPDKKYDKHEKSIYFLEQFDLDVLKNTYINVLYYYSNYVGKNITNCVRPSFVPHFKHIKPYYTRSEIINLALNLEYIKPSAIEYDSKKVTKLCEYIRKNDISSDVLLSHYTHIVNSEKIGLVQYYTLQGSSFINAYMRNNQSFKNNVHENIIHSLYSLVDTAPEFDKNYTLYRFINDDSYLQKYNIGDIYTSVGFDSMTRDPFYEKSSMFGLVLLKIKIPKNIKGIGLSIELVSNFPNEEEILLCPGVQLQLTSKNSNVPYYRPDHTIVGKMVTRYEFIYYGKVATTLTHINRPIPLENPLIDFMAHSKKYYDTTISEKLAIFERTCVSQIHQFNTKIGDKIYTILVDRYDSTTAYSDFYAVKTTNGLYMYTIIDNTMGFTLELGENTKEQYMCVNYYYRYSTSPKVNKILDDDLITFICKVAYHFEIHKIKLFCEYKSCNFINTSIKKKYYGGIFCVDFYEYLTTNKRRYRNILSTDLKPAYNVLHFDNLKTIDPKTLFKDDDRGLFYQLFSLTYKILPESEQSIAKFYLWIIKHHCIQIRELLTRINNLYNSGANPFLNDYYIIDPYSYLYNKNIINNYSSKKSQLAVAGNRGNVRSEISITNSLRLSYS
jgi:hypothetical protein